MNLRTTTSWFVVGQWEEVVGVCFSPGKGFLAAEAITIRAGGREAGQGQLLECQEDVVRVFEKLQETITHSREQGLGQKGLCVQGRGKDPGFSLESPTHWPVLRWDPSS